MKVDGYYIEGAFHKRNSLSFSNPYPVGSYAHRQFAAGFEASVQRKESK